MGHSWPWLSVAKKKLRNPTSDSLNSLCSDIFYFNLHVQIPSCTKFQQISLRKIICWSPDRWLQYLLKSYHKLYTPPIATLTQQYTWRERSWGGKILWNQGEEDPEESNGLTDKLPRPLQWTLLSGYWWMPIFEGRLAVWCRLPRSCVRLKVWETLCHQSQLVGVECRQSVGRVSVERRRRLVVLSEERRWSISWSVGRA